jgi:hypothetical protein
MGSEYLLGASIDLLHSPMRTALSNLCNFHVLLAGTTDEDRVMCVRVLCTDVRDPVSGEFWIFLLLTMCNQLLCFTQSSSHRIQSLFSRDSYGRSVMLTVHIILVPRFQNCGTLHAIFSHNDTFWNQRHEAICNIAF